MDKELIAADLRIAAKRLADAEAARLAVVRAEPEWSRAFSYYWYVVGYGPLPMEATT